ncbi:uncharacterized protein TNCV_905191 [Trichonephila clavipes]|nr:uncharacterized protein TNCV_905191 [Trichonephila clavipes]
MSVDAPSTSAIVEHLRYPKSVMVWSGICGSGKTPLVFVDEGVKMNQKVYQRDIFEVVLPGIDVSGKVGKVSKTKDALDIRRLPAPLKRWKRFLWKTKTIVLPHPPYSPDIVSSDLRLFSELVRSFQCHRFQSADETKSASQAQSEEITKNGFQKCFDDLHKP